MRYLEYAGYTINLDKVPKHLGVIMDGNGRWATKQGLTRSQGHKEGVKRIEDLLDFGLKYGIAEISLYTFSTENWNRSKQEINYLFRLVKLFFKKNMTKLKKEDVRIRIVGFEEGLPADVVEVLHKTSEMTKECQALTLNLCFNYGGHQDIAYAAKAIAHAVQQGNLALEDIQSSMISQYLKSSHVSPMDLLIRTSNEYRVSNFLPWQIAYTEFLFIETHWPDFSEVDFVQALNAYAQRVRRFGGVKT